MEINDLCEVLMPSDWMGAKTDEPNIWLKAKIIEKKSIGEGDSYIVKVYPSEKYHTIGIDRLQVINNRIR